MHTVYMGTRRGFMGLIGILLVAFIIAWWAIYYSPLAKTDTGIAEKKNIGLDAIDDANDIKRLLEARDKNLPL